MGMLSTRDFKAPEEFELTGIKKDGFTLLCLELCVYSHVTIKYPGRC